MRTRKLVLTSLTWCCRAVSCTKCGDLIHWLTKLLAAVHTRSEREHFSIFHSILTCFDWDQIVPPNVFFQNHPRKQCRWKQYLYRTDISSSHEVRLYLHKLLPHLPFPIAMIPSSLGTHSCSGTWQKIINAYNSVKYSLIVVIPHCLSVSVMHLFGMLLQWWSC